MWYSESTHTHSTRFVATAHERTFEVVIMNTVIICCRRTCSKYEPSRMVRAIMTGLVIMPIPLIRENDGHVIRDGEGLEVSLRTLIDRWSVSDQDAMPQLKADDRH